MNLGMSNKNRLRIHDNKGKLIGTASGGLLGLAVSHRIAKKHGLKGREARNFKIKGSLLGAGAGLGVGHVMDKNRKLSRRLTKTEDSIATGKGFKSLKKKLRSERGLSNDNFLVRALKKLGRGALAYSGSKSNMAYIMNK